MSEEVSIPTPSVSAEPASQARPSRKTRRYLLAALFSAIVPGAGQLFLGQRRKATLLLIVFAVLIAGFWPLRLLRFYAGFIALYSLWIGLSSYAVCSAQFARHLPRGQRPPMWWLLVTVPGTLLVVSLVGALVTRASGFRSFSIPSTSMEKTLRQGDHFVVDTASRLPERRDVVIFFRNHTFFVKRVIAIGGDSIRGEDGLIFVNGSEQHEPYVEHIGTQAPDWMSTFGPIAVPKGKCFVMGDNRDVSLDSRSADFGFVDNGSIIGKPLYIFGSDRVGVSIR